MFDKLKQLNAVREIQNKMKLQKTEGEENGVKVVMNGQLEIESISLNPELDIKTQEKSVLGAVKQAQKKVQNSLAGELTKFLH